MLTYWYYRGQGYAALVTTEPAVYTGQDLFKQDETRARTMWTTLQT